MKRLIFVSYLFLMGCSEAPEVNKYEKEAMNEEVRSLESFRANYHEFAEVLEHSEESEAKAKEFEQEKE